MEHCTLEIRRALQNNVRVEVTIAASIEPYFPLYARRASRVDYTEKFNETLDLFKSFVNKLPREEQQYFGLYGTQFPIMHSIGVYDDAIYISEISPYFRTSRPSYRLFPGTKAYDLFIEESIDILRDSTPLFGASKSVLEKNLGKDG